MISFCFKLINYIWYVSEDGLWYGVIIFLLDSCVLLLHNVSTIL